jgi:hypothetical protein
MALPLLMTYTIGIAFLIMRWNPVIVGAVCFAFGGMTGVFLAPVENYPVVAAQNPDHGKAGTKQKPRYGLDWDDSKPGPNRVPRAGVNAGNGGMISVPIALLESLSLSKSTRSMSQSILDGIDPIEAALGLSSVERDRIKSDWDKACERIREIEVKSMTTKDLEDGSVKISLPNLSKERKQVAEQFFNKLTETLGAERGEAFYATKQVNNMMAAEAGERSITVKVESVGKDEWNYHMDVQDASGSRTWVGESIPHEIRHLADAAGIFSTISEAVKSTGDK